MRGSSRFPKAARLTTSREYQRVFQGAPHTSTDDCFRLLAVSNRLDHPRLGLAVSRKAVPRAVQRNRIKRLVRESFRLNQARLPGLDIVVLARPRLQEKDNEALFASLNRHWSRLIRQCETS
ncbi:MAG: ribonuclease P protein component [Gammaproteobacteria bacterium]|nr:ribonuclease P protein component [Gammaproteobacteria bacterium]NIR98072.1 ribonuclease P protein component [Gammaproteobacteria bacterium]NIT63410.1 ribonuclease P protein component [Gammaproteobacteria bacterium]NIV20317.1 ribonuclease P protein component [Gammaproteobacteria bacterium]NIX10794.1 ribonuclease P protein component [Gammaproteobacteria bacterium]